MSDRDEPTAWEDINPPMALAPRQGQLSQCSDDEARTVFRNELTACLTLTAPAGMTEEARRDWFAVAWNTLKDIPSDILATGARKAREKCDHPSKIVPMIVAETKEIRRFRAECSHVYPPAAKRHVMERRGEPMSEADTAELNTILENLNATARYRPDGSRYEIGA